VKKNPGKVSYATSGAGTSQHLAGELLNARTKIDMVHVPYKGGGPALNDIVGGQVPVAILILSNVEPHVRSGKLRALAVVEATRAKAAPNVPTVAEAGVPGFAVPDTWIGLMGPARLPAPIVMRIDQAVTKAVATSGVHSRLDAAGFELGVVNADAFAKQAPGTLEMYRTIVTEARIKPE
jgi:tripartite-type tricarboxylate transporter receptor subunit TctC